MKTGIELVALEREEQITKHGFTHEYTKAHPEYYQDKQLLIAAREMLSTHPGIMGFPGSWDNTAMIHKMASKPYKERLIIAAALLCAEIDRVNDYTEDEPANEKVNAPYVGVCRMCKKETEVWNYLDNPNNPTCKPCFEEFQKWLAEGKQEKEAAQMIDINKTELSESNFTEFMEVLDSEIMKYPVILLQGRRYSEKQSREQWLLDMHGATVQDIIDSEIQHLEED